MIINQIEASLSGVSIKQSDPEWKIIHFLQVSGGVYVDATLTTNEGKINEDNDDIKFSEKWEHKTV